MFKNFKNSRFSSFKSFGGFQVKSSSIDSLQKKRKKKFNFLNIQRTLPVFGWIITLYRMAFGLSQKRVPESKKGPHLWGLGWDFHFLETPSVLFCTVPTGTTALIFLEGMFREPRSPRGKDNGGCDVTSMLGANGGERKKSWVALMSSGTPLLKEFHSLRAPYRWGCKMAAVRPYSQPLVPRAPRPQAL